MLEDSFDITRNHISEAVGKVIHSPSSKRIWVMNELMKEKTIYAVMAIRYIPNTAYITTDDQRAILFDKGLDAAAQIQKKYVENLFPGEVIMESYSNEEEYQIIMTKFTGSPYPVDIPREQFNVLNDEAFVEVPKVEAH